MQSIKDFRQSKLHSLRPSPLAQFLLSRKRPKKIKTGRFVTDIKVNRSCIDARSHKHSPIRANDKMKKKTGFVYLHLMTAVDVYDVIQLRRKKHQNEIISSHVFCCHHRFTWICSTICKRNLQFERNSNAINSNLETRIDIELIFMNENLKHSCACEIDSIARSLDDVNVCRILFSVLFISFDWETNWWWTCVCFAWAIHFIIDHLFIDDRFDHQTMSEV